MDIVAEREAESEVSQLEMARRENVRLAASSAPADRFVFWTLHPRTPCLVDLSKFAFGKAAPLIKSKRWKGGYSGRPDIMSELMAHVSLHYASASPFTIKGLEASLSQWWRVFDLAEKDAPQAESGKVVCCSDVTDLHAAVARRLAIKGSAHGTFLRLLNLRLREQGLKPRFWPQGSDESPVPERPEYWEIERIRHGLKRIWFNAIDRWSEADALAAQTPSASETGHQLYRRILGALEKTLASRTELNAHLGEKRCEALDPLAPLVFGLYPCKRDIQAAFHLILLYAGWNVQTLLDLQCSDDLVETHPLNPGYHLIRGFKLRGDSEHTMIGRDKRSDSPGSILRAILARTAPLRAGLKRQLTRIDDAYRKSPSAALLKEKVHLEHALRSPWLYVDGHALNEVRFLSSTSHAQGSTAGTVFLKELTKAINLNAPSDRVVKAVTAGDLRDSFVGFAYEFSNYNVLVAQSAAVHQSAETTVSYLRQRQWREKSAKLIRTFGNAFWGEIDRSAIVDPAILHALVMRGSISVEQRQRWMMHRDRTRVGVGCIDVKHPPREIDPDHVDDMTCRKQRCPLCPHAILFEDSFDHLSRRQAELEDIQTRIPMATWQQSSFGLELENTVRHLKRYDDALVFARLEFWRLEIREGRYTPQEQEGAYE